MYISVHCFIQEPLASKTVTLQIIPSLQLHSQLETSFLQLSSYCMIAKAYHPHLIIPPSLFTLAMNQGTAGGRQVQSCSSPDAKRTVMTSHASSAKSVQLADQVVHPRYSTIHTTLCFPLQPVIEALIPAVGCHQSKQTCRFQAEKHKHTQRLKYTFADSQHHCHILWAPHACTAIDTLCCKTVHTEPSSTGWPDLKHLHMKSFINTTLFYSGQPSPFKYSVTAIVHGRLQLLKNVELS